MSDKYHAISLICGIKKSKLTITTKQKQTYRYKEQTGDQGEGHGKMYETDKGD